MRSPATLIFALILLLAACSQQEPSLVATRWTSQGDANPFVFLAPTGRSSAIDLEFIDASRCKVTFHLVASGKEEVTLNYQRGEKGAIELFRESKGILVRGSFVGAQMSLWRIADSSDYERATFTKK